MRMLPILSACALLVGGGANASNYVVTFVSGKMRPKEHGDGVKGVHLVTATWTIPSLPEPGKCSLYDDNLYLTAYSDGRNTLQSLLARYQYSPNVASYLRLCIKHSLEASRASAFYMDLVTNINGMNYVEYVSHHGEEFNKYVTGVSIATYKNSEQTKYHEDDGKGGVFSLTGEKPAK